MFDDFDTMRQSDEYWPEMADILAETACDLFAPWEYEDENKGYFSEEEQEALRKSLKARSIDTGININDYF